MGPAASVSARNRFAATPAEGRAPAAMRNGTAIVAKPGVVRLGRDGETTAHLRPNAPGSSAEYPKEVLQ